MKWLVTKTKLKLTVAEIPVSGSYRSETLKIQLA